METEEQVLVVDAHVVQDFMKGSNVVSWIGNWRILLLDPSCRFVVRSRAEMDESIKQIIPYNVFLRPYERSVFVYRREPSGGEKRLHGKVSLGIGGHINTNDVPVRCLETKIPIVAFRNGIRREIKEEIATEGTDWPCVIQSARYGIINDDSDSVGRVHVGIVCFHYVYDVEILCRDAALEGLGFIHPDVLRTTFYGDMETWSKLVFDSLL